MAGGSSGAWGYAVLAAIVVPGVVLAVLASRNRPRRPPDTIRHNSRIHGRSLRGWQASVLREIRRSGRRR